MSKAIHWGLSYLSNSSITTVNFEKMNRKRGSRSFLSELHSSSSCYVNFFFVAVYLSIYWKPAERSITTNWCLSEPDIWNTLSNPGNSENFLVSNLFPSTNRREIGESANILVGKSSNAMQLCSSLNVFKLGQLAKSSETFLIYKTGTQYISFIKLIACIPPTWFRFRISSTTLSSPTPLGTSFIRFLDKSKTLRERSPQNTFGKVVRTLSLKQKKEIVISHYKKLF